MAKRRGPTPCKPWRKRSPRPIHRPPPSSSPAPTAAQLADLADKREAAISDAPAFAPLYECFRFQVEGVKLALRADEILAIYDESAPGDITVSVPAAQPHCDVTVALPAAGPRSMAVQRDKHGRISGLVQPAVARVP